MQPPLHSIWSGLASVQWFVSVAEKSVVLASAHFNCNQAHTGWACAGAVLGQVLHPQLRDLCVTGLGAALESPHVQHTWAPWSQYKLWGFFLSTATGINDSYCLWQVLFL